MPLSDDPTSPNCHFSDTLASLFLVVVGRADVVVGRKVLEVVIFVLFSEPDVIVLLRLAAGVMAAGFCVNVVSRPLAPVVVIIMGVLGTIVGCPLAPVRIVTS